jgi:hypothetical protein
MQISNDTRSTYLILNDEENTRYREIVHAPPAAYHAITTIGIFTYPRKSVKRPHCRFLCRCARRFEPTTVAPTQYRRNDFSAVRWWCRAAKEQRYELMNNDDIVPMADRRPGSPHFEAI